MRCMHGVETLWDYAFCECMYISLNVASAASEWSMDLGIIAIKITDFWLFAIAMSK